MVDGPLDNIDVERIPRKYLHNLENPLEKYNDDQFLKQSQK